jgi:hypothetical protein
MKRLKPTAPRQRRATGSGARGPETARDGTPTRTDAAWTPGQTGSAIGFARRADDSSRAREIAGLQQTVGNARVDRLIARRRGAQEEAGEVAAPTVGLAHELLGRLLVAPHDTPGLLAPIMAAPVSERRRAYDDWGLRLQVMAQLGAANREQLFSALLAGTPYHPGALSILYGELVPVERHDIDTATNARFFAETGIARALDWSHDLDKPLARRWLELRDLLMDTVHVRPGRVKAYEEYLSEAVDLLKGAAFGRSTGTAIGADAGDRYDLRFWEEAADVEVKAATGNEVGMLR